nr:hypothetical protein [Rhodococcus triatomae]
MSPDLLITTVAAFCRATAGRVVVAVDGADAANPVTLATAVAADLRAAGRPAAVVDLHDFVRPASVRLEHGRHDPHAYRDAWFDYSSLHREVLAGLHTRGAYLPRLWDEHTDRSARARVRPAAPDHVVLVAGPMLLGRSLPFDVTVLLETSTAALRRRTPAEDGWTVPALAEHGRTVTEAPDVVVRYDHPDRPAILVAR